MPAIIDPLPGFTHNRKEAIIGYNSEVTNPEPTQNEIMDESVNSQFANINQIVPDNSLLGSKMEYLEVEKLQAGSISSKKITLEVVPNAGDVFFAAGKTDFTITESGLILGIDDSDGDKAKFYIGSSTQYLYWDGSNLVINGVRASTQVQFAGSGADGAIDGTANVTITGSNNTLITKNYTSWAAGTRTLTVTPTGCIVVIKIQGDADFTNWAMTFTSKGNAGGAGGAAATSGAGSFDGNDGSNGTAVVVNTNAWQTIGGGGFGAKGTAAGGAAGAAGDVTPTGISTLAEVMLASNSIWTAPGAGGGGGGSGGGQINSTSGAGGAGGAGGGCLIFQIGGNVTFSSTTVSCDGGNGATGGNGVASATNDGAGGGGGGGGSGGVFICLYNGTATSSPTVDVTGGVGGSGGTQSGDTGGIEGGGGGGGASSIASDGTIGDAAGTGNGAAGGAGAAGLSLVVKNTAFA